MGLASFHRRPTTPVALFLLLAILLPVVASAAQPTENYWQPQVGMTWQIQLGEVPKASSLIEVDAYDIDLFEADSELLNAMEDRGIRTICYFSAGSYEAWRKDAKKLKKFRGAKLKGWQGEWWLDIRKNKVRNVMEQRLNLAVAKGCDAVDPDNVDGYANKNGLGLKRSNQIDYLRFLAREAHERGLAIGLKNAVELIPDLEAEFDFTVNEECFDYAECDRLQPFIDAGKPVLQIQYGDTPAKREEAAGRWCEEANRRRFSTLIKGWDLRSERIACQDRVE